MNTTESLPLSARRALAVLRILVGAILLWAFTDKVFGLGFATPATRSWLSGSSPTTGYLGNSDGWLAAPMRALAGQVWVDWLFMLGLLLVGGAFVLGVALRGAAVGGAVIMIMLWASSLPLQNNPLLDEHLVYATAMIALALVGAGATWGFAKTWASWLRRAPRPVRAVLA